VFFACDENPIYDVCLLFMKLSISNTFDNKGEVEIFNAYDPRPPENIGDKPILYLDILFFFR
jgi:hypothetical protein